MNDEANNNEAVSTSRLNFGQADVAQEQVPATEVPAPENTEAEAPFTPPSFLTGGVTQEAEAPVDNEASLNAAADTVAEDATVEAPALAPEVEPEQTPAPVEPAVEVAVDGSQADTVAKVADSLAEEVAKTDVPAATILEEAPAAVAEQVAEVAATDNTAVNALSGSENSIEDLRAQQDAINKKIADTKVAQKQAVLTQIAEVVKTYELTVQEVVDALGGLKSKRVGVPAKMKYRNPADGKEWSGRGKAPLWIKDQDKTQYLITA